MLAHVEADGALASRPMAVLQMDADGALWFFTDLRSSKVEHLRVVNLGFADIPHGTCVSMSGRGEIDTDRGRIERLWTAFAKPWFADGPDSPNLALLKFLPDTADYWDAPNNKMVRAFWSDRVDDGGRQTDLDGRTWLALRVAFGCTLGRCPVI